MKYKCLYRAEVEGEQVQMIFEFEQPNIMQALVFACTKISSEHIAGVVESSILTEI